MPWQSAHFAGSRSLSLRFGGAERTDFGRMCLFRKRIPAAEEEKKLSFYDPRCLLWRSTCLLLNASSMIMMMMAKHEPTASATPTVQSNFIHRIRCIVVWRMRINFELLFGELISVLSAEAQ
jgi:hypothetical protein